MIKQRISYRHYILKKVRWLISDEDATTIYKSMILPMFDIGDIYYQSANIDLIKGLQTIQNKCLHTIIWKKKWSGTHEAHKKLNIFTTENQEEDKFNKKCTHGFL